MRAGWFWGLVVAAAVLLGQPLEAAAQPNVEQGRQYYIEALEAYKQQRFERSIDLLKKAYEADPNPLYVYNRILVLEKTEEHRLALVLLDEYRRRMLDHPEIVEQDLLDMEARLRAAVVQEGPPARVPQPSETVEDPEPLREGVDWLGWGLVGGGLVAAGGALVSYVMANSLYEELRCAPNSGDGVDRTGCPEAAPPYEGNFEEASNRIDLYDGVAIGLGVLSVSALGWGIYELISEDEDGAAATADTGEPRLRLDLGPQRVGARLELRY